MSEDGVKKFIDGHFPEDFPENLKEAALAGMSFKKVDGKWYIVLDDSSLEEEDPFASAKEEARLV